MRADPPSTTGLSADEAARRLAREGPNELPQQRRRGWVRIAGEVAREPMVQLLLAAGLIYLVLGDRGEALMLLAFVAITSAINILEEGRTERVLEALRELSSPRALVLRDGERHRIAGRELVRGDLVFLAEGDRVPADARLLEANDLQADESLLTGESVPVRKRAMTPAQWAETASPAADGAQRPGGDDLPWVYSGSMVVRGRGLAEVVATGGRSELGRIGRSLESLVAQPTPLNRQVRRMVRVFAVLGLLMSAVTVLLYGWLRGDWLGGLLAGIALAMAMLPQEFVLILAVFMAMGAHRLSAQRVLTRRAAAIEALGSATVLCTDKTGTLTLNRMSIAEIRVPADGSDPHAIVGLGWMPADGEPPAPVARALAHGILASEVDAFDPMEKAFHDLGVRYPGEAAQRLDSGWRIVHEYPLTPDLMAMTHVWQAPAGGAVEVSVKGAPEAVAGLCGLGAEQAQALREQALRMAGTGMRVLAVARADGAAQPWPADPHRFPFVFLGLVGLLDPLRESVPGAIRECRQAGIRVVMITGDYPATARAIAAQAGIEVGEGVLDGATIARLDDEQLRARVADCGVFARVTPDQKLRLIGALRARGEVVAMTGDGVNDAPSLKAAQIGIAMGGRGTDVAREASAIVLLDDHFEAIPGAVRLGRRIHDNLRKALAFVLAVHLPIAGLTLVPLLFGLPLMFAPVHIAFLELVIGPVCSIVFEAEPAEGDVMDRPPRAPDAPLFAPRALLASSAQGLLVMAGVAALAFTLLQQGAGEPVARAAGFIALVVADFGLILFNRSFAGSWIAALMRPNRALWWVAGSTLLLMAAVLAIAPLRELFRFGLLSPAQLAAALLTGLGVGGLLFLFRPLFSARSQLDRRQHR